MEQNGRQVTLEALGHNTLYVPWTILSFPPTWTQRVILREGPQGTQHVPYERGIDVGEQRNKMEGTQCHEWLYGTGQPAGLPLNPYVKKKDSWTLIYVMLGLFVIMAEWPLTGSNDSVENLQLLLIRLKGFPGGPAVKPLSSQSRCPSPARELRSCNDPTSCTLRPK